MRATSVLRTLLALHRTRVVALEFNEEALVVDVEPSWQIPRCSGCGKKRRSVYDSRVRTWRHLDIGGIKTLLRYRMRRVSCKKFGVVVETVPWAETGSRFTVPMEGHVAYHAQRTDKTTVSTLMRVAWRTVGQIIKRYVRRERNEMGDPLENLRTTSAPLVRFGEMNWEKAGIEEYGGREERAGGAARCCRRVSSEGEAGRAEAFEGKHAARGGPRPHGVRHRGTPRRARCESDGLAETQWGTGGAENSRSCPRGAGRGGGRAPRSSAAMSCGAVTARVTRMGPRQREQTEMSMRKTRTRSFIHGSREGAASRS